jgi:acetylornithine deacetylase/succinyl-diaminopimelate desuccinylase-like protein
MNYSALRDETIRHLQALIRLNTSNPPGNESLAVTYLAEVLTAEGIPLTTIERRPGRGNLVARLKGDGSQAPLLLMGHTDVVPAEAQHWTHPPFEGVIADGNIWGRGALDMKFMVAYELATFLTIHREGVPLKRDLIFAATADEEVAQGNGIDWLAQEHPDLIRAEYALNELGAFTMWFGETPVYGIQVAEKGTVWAQLTAKGVPGHASVPSHDNPLQTMATALNRLAAWRAPLHLTESTQSFVTGIANILGLPADHLIALAHDLSLPNPAPDRLPDQERRELHAILHNTCVPTVIKGGYKTNVIPSTVTVELDGRNLPGFTTADYLSELRTALDPRVELEVFLESPPLEVSHDNDLYRLMKHSLEDLHPGAVVLPMLMTGATDAKFLAPLGIKVYGFSPIRFEPDHPGPSLIHSHDERIPVTGVEFGVRALYEVVRKTVI